MDMDPMVTPYDEIERLLKENAALRREIVKRDEEFRERTGEYIRACNEITALRGEVARLREAVEWVCGDDYPTWKMTRIRFVTELRRRAGME